MNGILLALTASNGLLMEIVRALIQRPRPVVLSAPATEGANIHHYTSFYSGHTSFVALALFFTWMWLRKTRPERRGLFLLFSGLYPLLTAATGTLRVLGGRHYPTDTLAGWAFGSLLAWLLGKRLLDQLKAEFPPSPSI